MLNFLTVFQSLIGPVKGGDIGTALRLLVQGMVGIFLVMLLIYLVVVILNKATKNNEK